MTLTIRVSTNNLSASKAASNVSMEDQIEINKKFIHLFKKCWIKYSDENGVNYQGGFLIDIEPSTDSSILSVLVIRNIKQEIFKIDKNTHTLYCKKDNQQYILVSELIQEWQKLDYEKAKFEREKKKFFAKYH